MVRSREIVLSVATSPLFLGPSADASVGAAHLPLSLAPIRGTATVYTVTHLSG